MAERVMIAMSGGVDSSAAALLLQRQGFDCVGVTMRQTDDCESAVQDAARVCRYLGIPHRVADLRDAFRREVIAPFAAAYEAGLTPNPCVLCNRSLKFGRLLALAEEEQCRYLATGHYARVFRAETGRFCLARADDGRKDQTYMLWTLSQEVLSRLLFPLGEVTDKAAVRRMAEEAGLPVAHKADSQDICFIPDGDYASFIARFTGRTYPEGDFTDAEGHVLGRHRGLIRYTVGQRKGLGLALPAPLYVGEKRADENRVVLVPDEALYRRELTAQDMNFVSMAPTGEGTCFRAMARIRYHHEAAPATVEMTGPDACRVVFDEPVRAVTPGQSLVLYRDDLVLGGGIII